MGVVMTPQEIITQDAERAGQRPGAVLHGVAVAVDKKKAALLQDNKSLVVLEPIGKSKHEYSAHLFTADAPAGLVRSMIALRNQMRRSTKFKKIYSDSLDQKILKLLETAGFNVQKSDKKDFKWMAEV